MDGWSSRFLSSRMKARGSWSGSSRQSSSAVAAGATTLILLDPSSRVTAQVLRVRAWSIGFVRCSAARRSGSAIRLSGSASSAAADSSSARSRKKSPTGGTMRGANGSWRRRSSASIRSVTALRVEGLDPWPAGPTAFSRSHIGTFCVTSTLNTTRLPRIAPAAALVEHETDSFQQVRPIAHDPTGADPSARLLVRRGQEDDVAFKGCPGPGEGQEGLQVHDAQALRVEGSAAVEVAVLVGSGQRIVLPEPRVGGHDVDVVEQDDARGLTPFEPRPDAAPARLGLHGFVGDALALEDVREERDRLALVARRVRRVDADVLLEPSRCLRQPRIAGTVLTQARRRRQSQERSHRRNDHGGGAHRVGR